MAYCTLQDLLDRFGTDELAEVAPDGAGGIDADKVEGACNDAAGEVDGYAASAGYSVPLASPPRTVTVFAADIARYRLHDDHASETIANRYQEAVRFLRAVAGGQVKLGATSPSAGGVSTAEVVQPARKRFNGGLR